MKSQALADALSVHMPPELPPDAVWLVAPEPGASDPDIEPID